MDSNLLKQLFSIFFTFFRIGLFTFGGGYAMIPLIEREIVDKKKWVQQNEITDLLAISQTLPGVIAINSAAFIGYKRLGRKGALAATLGVILPSFIIIVSIASLISQFGNNHIVQSVFYGIRPVVIALIGVAGYKISKSSIKDKTGTIILIISIVLIILFNIHPIFIIIGSAIFGLLVYQFCDEKIKSIIEKEVKEK